MTYQKRLRTIDRAKAVCIEHLENIEFEYIDNIVKLIQNNIGDFWENWNIYELLMINDEFDLLVSKDERHIVKLSERAKAVLL
jgi:hypothetical protein